MVKNCNECLHNPICQMWRDQESQDASSFQLSGCCHFKDRSQLLRVPCKIGDFVWVIRNYHGTKHPQKGQVSELLISKDLRLVIVVKHIARGEWGKEVFATYDEAQAAIKERENGENYNQK